MITLIGVYYFYQLWNINPMLSYVILLTKQIKNFLSFKTHYNIIVYNRGSQNVRLAVDYVIWSKNKLRYFTMNKAISDL